MGPPSLADVQCASGPVQTRADTTSLQPHFTPPYTLIMTTLHTFQGKKKRENPVSDRSSPSSLTSSIHKPETEGATENKERGQLSKRDSRDQGILMTLLGVIHSQ